MALIHKSISPFGDWIIFMNGVPLYKKWPTGRSIVFEKYGINTDNADRDNGHYGGTPRQNKETSAVQTNPFKHRSTDTLAKMISDLLEDVCSCDEDVVRATRLFTVATDALHWKQDEGLADFNLAELRNHFNLRTLIDLNDPGKFPTMPVEVRSPIRKYLWALPEFRPETGHKQPQATFDCNGQSEMDLTKLLGSLAEKYQHLLFEAVPALLDANSVRETPEITEAPTDEIPDDIMEIASQLDFMRGGPTSMDIARAIFEERKRGQAEIERLRKAADYISPYLRYTIGEESPGYAPTMPSAVAAFHVAFDIDTHEKRIARLRFSLEKSEN